MRTPKKGPPERLIRNSTLYYNLAHDAVHCEPFSPSLINLNVRCIEISHFNLCHCHAPSLFFFFFYNRDEQLISIHM